jgi:hypothetical protein
MSGIKDDDRYKGAKVFLGDKCLAKFFYTSLSNNTIDEEVVDGFAMDE